MLYLDKNSLTGDAHDICEIGADSLENFVTDCEEVTCTCCEYCCYDDDDECNQMELMVSFDDGYDRDQYIFEENLVFDISIVSDEDP